MLKRRDRSFVARILRLRPSDTIEEHHKPIGIVSARDARGPELKEFVAEVETREHISEILA